MALEEEIVVWASERPAWQREVMRRVAAGDGFSDDDYEALVEVIANSKVLPLQEFGLDQLPRTTSASSSVCLLAIEKLDHVNALASQEPLTCEASGMTIVYGDNGSGKSGYARLLKRVTRARHQEEVLSDVFRDTSMAKPTAVLSVRIGDKIESFAWPQSAHPALQRMLFYDTACGSAYATSESDFPYRPSALFVMDGLIDACVEIRARIDAKLVRINASRSQLPTVVEQAQQCNVGRFLASLSASSSLQTLDTLIEDFHAAKDTVEELKNQEASLRVSDTTKVRQQYIRNSEKMVDLQNHLWQLDARLGIASLARLREQKATVVALEAATSELARSMELEPLPGVGSSPWKELWEAAVRFSNENAYPNQDFPYTAEGGRCVLCQQSLDAQSRDRLVRFRDFVKNDTQVRLKDANRAYESSVVLLRELTVTTAVVTTHLNDLEGENGALVAEVRQILSSYEAAAGQLREALSNQQVVSDATVDPRPTIAHLAEAIELARKAADNLSTTEGTQKHLAALVARRAELELLEQVTNSRSAIVKEIARLAEQERLEGAKSAAATTGITKKIVELSEEGITEVVRDKFTRETERLHLERVTISRTRAEKGSLLHQPKLLGTRQQVTLPRVFSEGERTALGLAAFFTEASLDTSNSALILDDPVTSLDHIRRGRVASRLASLAQSRQVILFTHDVAFVADLKREAGALGVLVAERSVTRSRAEDRKPGSCANKHPWKAKDVSARLNELKQGIDQMRNDATRWDEQKYDDAVATWAGNLSETWERIFSQEIVGSVLGEGGIEVRPMMVKVLARFSDEDHREFDGSYGRTSQWAKRHDKSTMVNYVAPDIDTLETELRLVENWFKRVKAYKT